MERGTITELSGFDNEFWTIFLLTLRVCGTAVLISSLLGIPIGVWLGMSEFRGKRFVSALIHTGMAIPPVVIGLVLYMLLSASGPLALLNCLFTPKAKRSVGPVFVLALLAAPAVLFESLFIT